MSCTPFTTHWTNWRTCSHRLIVIVIQGFGWKLACGLRVTKGLSDPEVDLDYSLPCFLAVRVMVSLKVLQLELSPPHTPHLSSCFEEPNTPSQPTFCKQTWKFSTHAEQENLQVSPSHTWIQLTSHSPRTQTLWGSLYEQRVPSRTTLCMKNTLCVSLDWQCRLQRLVAVRHPQAKMTGRYICNQFWSHRYNKPDCVNFLNERSMSLSALCLIVSVCVSHTTTIWVARDRTWQFITVRINTPTASHLLQMDIIQTHCLLVLWH